MDKCLPTQLREKTHEKTKNDQSDLLLVLSQKNLKTAEHIIGVAYMAETFNYCYN